MTLNNVLLLVDEITEDLENRPTLPLEREKERK